MGIRHASPEIDGDKVRELRKAARLTVTQLAEKIGKSVSYVSAIERRRRPTVGPATFGDLCTALGVTDDNDLLRQPEEQADAA
jgi:transcriptional regulator with XRE-family HTH domain